MSESSATSPCPHCGEATYEGVWHTCELEKPYPASVPYEPWVRRGISETAYWKQQFLELAKQLDEQEPVIEAARAWYSGVYLRRKRIGTVIGSKETTLAERIKALSALEKK